MVILSFGKRQLIQNGGGKYMVYKLEFNNKKQCGLWLIAIGSLFVLLFSIAGPFFRWLAFQNDLVRGVAGHSHTFIGN